MDSDTSEGSNSVDEGMMDDTDVPSAPSGDLATKLSRMLDGGDEALAAHLEASEAMVAGHIASNKPMEGLCVECEDHVATLLCQQCEDELCRVCYDVLHKKGNRRSHESKVIREEAQQVSQAVAKATAAYDNPLQAPVSQHVPMQIKAAGEHEWTERAKYIPLRLTLHERKVMRLIDAAMTTSDYTDKVDHGQFRNKSKRVHAQLMEICATLSGLVVSADYREGQAAVSDRHFTEQAPFFQMIFEIGRRYKIMNPEKMRGTYGKLLYLMQDAQSPQISSLLDFSVKKSIVTVADKLRAGGAEAMLADKRVEIATRAITQYTADGGEKHRSDIRYEVKAKERAVEELSRQYRTNSLKSEDIRQCLYSIGDNRSWLLGNRDPVERMITYLNRYFSPNDVEEGYSLEIRGGQDGHRLTHTHDRQFHYILQSLTLWRDISNDMFQLWYLADEDLLDPSNSYKLVDTGQGLNRVQQAPRIAKAMRRILHRCQKRVGEEWVGSSVVHLGDHNVPNALMFIDKYTQISRILNPIVITLQRLPSLAEDKLLAKYIKTAFGSVEGCKKAILLDFFRGAFDGSGADNFFDAGSCVDGRLTSAWAWGSSLSSKPFYKVFLLAGFTSFDGSFA